MNRRRARWLEGAAVFAVLVAMIDTLGWREWRLVVDLMAVNSEAAAHRLAGGRLVRLPSAVERTRKLATDQLAEASTESVVAALTEIGGLQRRWIPTAAIGFLNLASEEFLRGRIRESVNALRGALLRDPTSPSLHRLQALFLFSVGERSPALAELAIAEAIAPGLREPVVELTPGDESRVKFEGLRLRTEFYPRRATENALALARAIRQSGDEAGAHSELARFRGQATVEIELARWAIDSGELDDAVEMLLPIASRSANPRRIRAQAWSVIAVARDLGGDAEAALAAAGEALALDPNSTAPYLTLAGLAQGRGDLESAFEHLQRAWGMDPANTGLLTRIASVAEQAGRTADALLALERAVEIEPGTPRLAVLLVELQLRTGHYSEAAMSLSRALDRHPTDPGLLRLADRLPREVGIR